jgi:hypothetical protein
MKLSSRTSPATERLHVTNSVQKHKLILNGFVEQGDDLIMPIQNADDRIKVLVRLIELGALFSAGRDWSPAELVEYYREQGLISGPYRVIEWTSPEQFLVSTR